MTINKVCGSGLKAVMLGHDAIKAGSSDVVIAGGMESMTNAPYLLPKARGGMRMGHGQVLDHMFTDGLQSPYDQLMMGMFGEMCADKYDFTRADQDGFAIASVERAQRALHEGDFKNEIVPVTVKTRRAETVVDEDEEPHRCNIGKISTLRPAFKKDGTVTAGNASKISDGAAATVLMTASEAQQRGLELLARIVAHATFAQEPEWFTTAPAKALPKALAKSNLKLEEIDFFEFNEAFSVVGLANMKILGLNDKNVNVNGGAVSLGHPLGCSGARILITLLNVLEQNNAKLGAAAICNGGGGASAIIIEKV